MHLPFERIAQRLAHALWRVNVPFVARGEERSEEGYALYVVPMRVANEDVAAERGRFGRKQVLPELTDACSAINDDEGTTRCRDLSA